MVFPHETVPAIGLYDKEIAFDKKFNDINMLVRPVLN